MLSFAHKEIYFALQRFFQKYLLIEMIPRTQQYLSQLVHHHIFHYKDSLNLLLTSDRLGFLKQNAPLHQKGSMLVLQDPL